jgi:hypothetical protein
MKINILLLLIISCTSTLLLSCREREDRKVVTLIDFTKEFKDSINPNKNYTYTAFFVEIKGEVNDSIIFEFHESKNAVPFYFNRKIDEQLSFDYYGGFPCVFIFKPYKASKGELKIKYGLY